MIDLDSKSFFDSISHELVERALAHHTGSPWVRLYIARWLRAPMQRADGTQEARTKGTPQGGVVSPLISNLYLHYAFDAWMQRNFPSVPFERYADDSLVHCKNRRQAEKVLEAIRSRFAECGLELHETKTQIVYCKDDDRRGEYEQIAFDFRVVEEINPILRGWVNYYAIGHASRSFCTIKDYVEKKVRRHLMRAHKRPGFGWKRWNRGWLYSELGLFNGYRVRWPETKARPADRSHKPFHEANRSA